MQSTKSDRKFFDNTPFGVRVKDVLMGSGLPGAAARQWDGSNALDPIDSRTVFGDIIHETLSLRGLEKKNLVASTGSRCT